MKNKQLILMLALPVLLILLPSVYSTCYVQAAACNSGNNSILRLDSTTNSHLELSTESLYTNNVCCDQINVQASGGTSLLYLSSATNAHANTGSASGFFEINVSEGVIYNDTGDCNAGECVVRISDWSNAHVSDCSDPTYDIRVCSGPSILGTLINQVCGNITVDGLKIDPACDDSAPAPSEFCNPSSSNHCVYENASNVKQCYAPNSIVTKADNRNIECTNGGWCPEGYTFDSLTGDCLITVNTCNSGYGYNTPAPFVPKVFCEDFASFINNESTCLSDFTAPVGPLPFNESCCLLPEEGVGFTWTNQSQNFSFYEPSSIRVY